MFGSGSVNAYDDVLNGSFSLYLQLSSTIGDLVQTHADMVNKAVRAQREFIVTASQSRKPDDMTLMSMLKPTSEYVEKIQELRNKNRTHELFNHLSAISESIPALGWVTIAPTPGPYVKEMNDASQFYTNKVLVAYKDKNKTHVDWAKAWLSFLTELQAYIKQFHTTGLVWNPQGGSVNAGAQSNGGPAGGPAPPPPPPAGFFDDIKGGAMNQDDDARRQLFSQINQGTDISKGLRKVTADQQTHKNPTLKQGPTPYKAPAVASKPAAFGRVEAPKGPPKFDLEGKKWCVEYHVGNKQLVIDQTEMNQSINVYKCDDCVLQVKGKVNSITVDGCKKFSIVFENIVAVVEFINCAKIQAQAMGVVPTVTFDKVDGVELYLGKESLNVEILSAKCSALNISVPDASGDYKEHPIPEQFKTVWAGRGFKTEAVDKA